MKVRFFASKKYKLRETGPMRGEANLTRFEEHWEMTVKGGSFGRKKYKLREVGRILKKGIFKF